jgi:hypothetical protein
LTTRSVHVTPVCEWGSCEQPPTRIHEGFSFCDEHYADSLLLARVDWHSQAVHAGLHPAEACADRTRTLRQQLANAQRLITLLRTELAQFVPEPVGLLDTDQQALVMLRDGHSGYTRDELVGKDRATRLVAARHAVMWRMRRELGLSLPAIGRLFGRDHTTVLNGIRRHEQRTGATSSLNDSPTTEGAAA